MQTIVKKTDILYDQERNLRIDNKSCSNCLPPIYITEEKFKIYDYIKRIKDIVLSLTALIILSPLFIAIGLLIKIFTKGGPIFYAHRRVGYKDKPFMCYKFRTMVKNADEVLKNLLDSDPESKKEFEETFKLKKDPRIIPIVGHFLRKTSLDELPQIYNVFLGEMSIVGPRPIIEKEKEKYGIYIKKVLSVKPGITGFWQVSGRNNISYDQRVNLDLSYAENHNLLFDLKIMFKTVYVMLFQKDTY